MTIDGNLIRMSMPFAKVDKKRRLVSGFATLDNVDTEGDVVEASASAKAFARARGNIREMHDKIAVGRMVDFREDEYFDKASGETYRGMYVTARVSEGAPNTWLKVLDGTLSGFSIGGEILEFDNKIHKAGDGTTNKIRLIKDYDLQELSLVDNPANPLANFDSIQKANVVSFQKSASGSVEVSGMVADTVLQNVFICPNDDNVLIKRESELTDPECGTKMEMAGWFEEGPDRKDKIRNIVNKFLSPQEESPSSEGGVEMAKSETLVPNEEHDDGSNVESADETENAVVDVDETDNSEVDTEKAKLTEAVSPDEVEDDEATQISKTIKEMHDSIIKTLDETKDATAERVSAVEAKIEKATSDFLAEQSKLREEMTEISESLRVTKRLVTELENGLEKMNRSDALKKSVELEDDQTDNNVQKSTGFWNGAFSGNRKGFSVDNI